MFLVCSFNFVYNVKLAPELYCALDIKPRFYRDFSVRYLIGLTQPIFFKPKNDIPKIKIKVLMVIFPNSEKGKSESAITYPIKAFQRTDFLFFLKKKSSLLGSFPFPRLKTIITCCFIPTSYFYTIRYF